MALKIIKHLLHEVPIKDKNKGKKYILSSNPQEEEEMDNLRKQSDLP